MRIHVPLYYLQPATGVPTYVIVLVFLTPLVVGLGWFIYKTRHAKSWRKGVFPQKIPFNQENLLEAYLALSSILILFDYETSKDKTKFINSYFNQYFKSETYNFGDSLLFSMRHPIDVQTVVDWLNKYLTSEVERGQVIYFLTGVAMVNGSISSRELVFLKQINDQLHLSEDQLVQVVTMYKSYYRESKRKEEYRTQQVSHVSSKSEREQAQKILNVQRGATLSEIKSAYRKLAKEYHPDRFSTGTEAQQKIAEEKFIQIQKSYELLSNK